MPDEKPCSVQRKNSAFTGLEREHESNGSSNRKAGDVLWEEREASAPLPEALYVIVPSCVFMYNASPISRDWDLSLILPTVTNKCCKH